MSFEEPQQIPLLEPAQMSMLQTFLLDMGYPPGEIDGIWGPKTKAAWVAFAAANSLDQDTIDATVWGYVAAEADRSPLVAGDGSEPEGVSTNGESVAGDGILDEAERKVVLEKFPQLAYLMDNPEIAALLEQAIAGVGWTAAEMSAYLPATEWWQKTSVSQREFDMSMHLDPASMERDIQQQQITLENMFGLYGIKSDPAEIKEFAIEVLRNGMDPNETLRRIGQMARSQAKGNDSGNFGGDLTGDMGNMAQKLTEVARQYHLGYSEDQMEEWAIRITEGSWSWEGAVAAIKQQATAAYPPLAERIAEGMTVEDFYAPTKNRLAQYLDMNPNDIDLTQDRWSDVTQLIDDENGGSPRTMTFSELGRYARGQDEWWQTDDANQQTYGVLNGLLKTMGAIA